MFAYGFSVSQFKVFPYRVLKEAKSAAEALASISRPAEIAGLDSYRNQIDHPTAIQHTNEGLTSLILVSAGHDALKNIYPEGCMAWIMDREGMVVHAWRNHPDLWSELTKVTRVPGISGAINPAGIHLFNNGDLLATFHGMNTFPFAIGMAKFDAQSHLLWKREILTHHNFSVAPDGRIFTPAVEVVDSPIRIGETNALVVSDNGKIYRDVVLVLDADGNELDRIPILDALSDSGWIGLCLRSNESTFHSDDPTHLNEVYLLGDALPVGEAAKRLGLAADDLLVSMRNINTVGILDPKTKRFKWISSGTTVGQHSPRPYDQGVLVLDNLGGNRLLGGTQLVHIRFQTGLPKTLFPRPSVSSPDLCRTANSGHLDINLDGKHALMAVTHEGAIWEIDLQSGKVDWEYIYAQSDRAPLRRSIGCAKYVSIADFIRPKS